MTPDMSNSNAPEKASDEVYQTYTSNTSHISLFTDKGKRIVFVNHQHITNDPKVITYLDEEISNGHPEIKKGAPVDKIQGDPLEGLRAKFFEEFKQQQLQANMDKATGANKRDFGSNEHNAASKLNVASSTQQVTTKPSIQAKDPSAGNKK